VSLAADSGRAALFARLAQRNRVVLVLRLVVPGLGLVACAALAMQLVATNAASRFTLSRIETLPQTFAIDAPEYAGILPDGGSYSVSAAAARPRADGDGIVALTDASVVLERADGTRMTVNAASADLSAASEEVFITGIAEVEDSTGTRGSVADSILDWAAQTLTSTGAVAIDYADGTTLLAEGMRYSLADGLWTFTAPRVTVPDTPGADAP
jgi:hypothetical protein